jgi:glutathione S-transferase
MLDSQIVLYHNGMSSSSQKVRLVLAEKNLKWESRPVNLREGEHQHEWYRALNARAVVPTLVDGTHAIQESTVINEYLEAKFPAPSLMPKDELGKARIRLWTKQVDDSLHDGCIAVLAYAIAFRTAMLQNMDTALAQVAKIPDPFKRERRRDVLVNGLESIHVRLAIGRMDQLFEEMDGALSSSEWLTGNEFSLADLSIIPYATRMADLTLLQMAESRPRVLSWFERCKSRQSYAEAVTKWEDQVGLGMMKRAGEEHWPKVKEIGREETANAK